MKQFLLALGLLVAALFAACKSSPDSAGHHGECKVCASNEAIKTAVPDAPAQPCASCMQHEMLKACPKCAEMGKPCCDGCAAKMACPECQKAGGECKACKLAKAECTTCAVKSATWNDMACPTCKDAATPCGKCAELRAKLDGVKCVDCTCGEGCCTKS
ncbi:MAG: hypothetical protein JNM84_05265 [Planctomycetes bacterium]|nr:hypothetical protein [Planctomycetota bacterium]